MAGMTPDANHITMSFFYLLVHSGAPQEYLAQKKTPTLLEPPLGSRHRPTVGFLVSEVFLQSVQHRFRMGRVPREQKVLKGHLPRVIYHRVYFSIPG